MVANRASDDQTTRERILVVAERLFAERGIGFVSVRDITTAARANTAAINYHFGSKDGLLEAIVVERAAQLGKRRNELLDAIEASPRPQLRDLVAALVIPMAELAADGEGGGRHWIRVKADLRGKPEMGSLLESAFEPYTKRYLDVLERVTPQLSPAVRVARFAVAKEAVELVFANDQLPGWVARQVEFRAENLADIVIDFVTAGFAVLPSTAHGTSAT
jgi:AcrR family transcriptional regulator